MRIYEQMHFIGTAAYLLPFIMQNIKMKGFFLMKTKYFKIHCENKFCGFLYFSLVHDWNVECSLWETRSDAYISYLRFAINWDLMHFVHCWVWLQFAFYAPRYILIEGLYICSISIDINCANYEVRRRSRFEFIPTPKSWK